MASKRASNGLRERHINTVLVCRGVEMRCDSGDHLGDDNLLLVVRKQIDLVC